MADDAMTSERQFKERDIKEFRGNDGKVVDKAPGFGEYEKKTDRVIPAFALTGS